MTEHFEQMTTRTGLKVLVRAARPSDEAMLREFFHHVAPDDLRFRFLGTVKEVEYERLVEMLRVDHGRSETYLAFEREGERIIAVALACDESMEVGEVAVSVRSDRKGLGISWELMKHVIQIAKEKGVKRLQSVEDRANLAAIGLEKELGFTSRPVAGDPATTLLELALAQP